MLKLTSPSQLSSLPPPYRQAVKNALKNLCFILVPDHPDRGFVLFVEENDTLNDINQACHRDISTGLEGTFLDGNCLIGVVLWGNSGEGVTIVCPDQKGYAEEVAEILRKHL
ncbi:MAG: hypothetical protein QNK24_06770 [Desulfuromusa sp.]|nr:hypothetical protein [Desulfuromusa sp.]